MDIALHLFQNLIPLYVLIAIGFAASKFFEISRDTLANLAIFICLPIVVFGFILNLEFQPAYILLPFLIYGIMAVIGLGFLFIGNKVFKGAEANILAMAASMGNTGYFGLPVALMLLPADAIGIYIFAMLGGSVYEATIGYYIAARGKFDARQSLLKLAKFPTLYAVCLAFIVKLSGFEVPELFNTYWGYFKGTYVVIGMMIIGSALAGISRFVIGPRFLTLVFLGKCVTWPALVALFVGLDQHWLHMFDAQIYKILFLLAIVPPAANIVAFSAQLDLMPEKAATMILISTIFALFYIPLVLMLLPF